MKCVYCELPEIKERGEVASNELAWAFPTNIPIVPGHILIVPKRCVAKIKDMTKEEIEAILNLRDKLEKALIELFDAEGFNYSWNEGKIAGQSVPHFHLHMLPRKYGDNGITEYEPRKFLYRPGSREETSEDELQAIAKMIKNKIK
jgi:histidine triad (HIT) family protein